MKKKSPSKRPAPMNIDVFRTNLEKHDKADLVTFLVNVIKPNMRKYTTDSLHFEAFLRINPEKESK